MPQYDARYWLGQLEDFFQDVARPLEEILGASSCRESWLQGEAFRFFAARRSNGYDFRVNEVLLRFGEGARNDKKADLAFSVDHKISCLGELKLFGTVGYYTKNLTGGSIKSYLEAVQAGETVVFQDDESLERKAQGGLLWDYYRLVRHESSEAADPLTRILVLVVDRTAGRADSFGQVIQKVEFEKPAAVLLESNALLVKAWVVGAS